MLSIFISNRISAKIADRSSGPYVFVPLSNKSKMFVCLIAMVSYAVLFVHFLKQPLLNLIANLPRFLHDLIFLTTMVPIAVLGACSVFFYLRNEKKP